MLRLLCAMGLWLLAAALGAAPVLAFASAALPVAVPKLSAPLPLDPALTDPAWSALPWHDDFQDLSTKTAAIDGTSAAIAYDDKTVFVGFRVRQSGPVTATQTTDAIGFGVDDFVGVGIDVSGNGERAYYFEVTPRGTKYQQAAETSRYAPAWKAAAAPSEGGWNAVMAIPMSALQFSGSGPQHWRINFIRAVVGANRHESWAFDPLMPDGPIPVAWPGFRESRWWPTTTGIVARSSGARRQPRFEPYALGGVGSGRNIYVDAAGNESQRNERHLGLDLAVPITSTVTGVASLNPDFSNVEIDQQTIQPQQFQRNLIETRPFFAQGANYINAARQWYEFNLPNDTLFYTPNIGPFDRGFKVEGTSGSRSFGVLETRGSDPTFDDVAWGLSSKRPNNTMSWWSDGVLANLANGRDSVAEVGASGRSLASGLVYSAQYGREWGSFVSDTAQAQQLRGFVDIQRAGSWGNVESAVGFVDIGPQYNPQAGFTNVADVLGPEAFLDYQRTVHGGALKSTELYLYADRWIDSQGFAHLSDADVFVTLRSRNAMRLVLGDANSTQRSYDGNLYSGYSVNYANPSNVPFKALSAEAVLGDGAPNSLDMYYQIGPFGGPFVNNFNIVGTKALPKNFALSLQYSGNLERPPAGPENSQWLSRVALSFPVGRSGNASIAYRVIDGTGGFATPGKNFAASIHEKFANGNELYVNWGAPAAASTVDRFIIKYVMRINGGLTS